MNKQINVLIIEDEAPAQRMLTEMLQEIEPGWNITGTLDSVESSVKWFEEHPQPDVIFMDIQLSDGLSFEIFKQVEVKSLVIFTTAYDEYAIQAFKVNSIDYLLKPIRKTELQKAILKLKELARQFDSPDLQNNIDFNDLIETINNARQVYRNRFLIHQGDSFITLATQSISYLYSKDRITYAVSKDNSKHVLDFTLEQLEEQLDPNQFYRANRQIILNVDAISRIHNYFNGKLKIDVKPDFQEEITISRLKASDFKQWIDR